MDASTLLLARSFEATAAGLERRRLALELLASGQTRDGGWGPFLKSPPEVFDTALGLLALDGYRDQPGVPNLIRKARTFLVENQEDDGSWVETTRPSGAESYAQRLSTTGWATLALLTVRLP
jgi:squalene cyclase